jgi:hypothetical protein
VSTPEPKRDPKAPDKVLTLSKVSVAQSQLATALTLWFHYGDPISILTLANAAHDCYSALGGHAGKPSPYQTWLNAQSRSFKERVRYMQVWVKHGKKHLTKKARYMPIVGELLMFDSIECHSNLFGTKTHLMLLFIARWVVENPSKANAPFAPRILRFARVDDLGRWGQNRVPQGRS